LGEGGAMIAAKIGIGTMRLEIFLRR